MKLCTFIVEEEGAEEGETVTKEVVEDIISEDEKKVLFSSLIEKKLMTSKSRYRGFLVELGDFPLKYEDALDLFTDKVPEVVKEEEEAGEEGIGVLFSFFRMTNATPLSAFSHDKQLHTQKRASNLFYVDFTSSSCLLCR